MFDKEALLARIEVNPKIMVGKPIIKGTRLTVELILELLAAQWTISEILEEHPSLEEQDIYACLLFAQVALSDVTFMPVIAKPC